MARIAREVHDEIGSLLTGLKMDLGWAKQRIAARDPLLAEKCAAMMRLTDITVDATRRIATGLRPSALDHLGVGAAIEEYAGTFRDRTGLGCKVDVMLGPNEPNANQGIALFRIAQEGLTNVARHSRAHHVQVQLSVRDNAYRLTITDDGIGIESNERRSALGLRGMRERVAALGGQFSVGRGENGGTVLDAWIPINQTETIERAAQ
jgi:signal transduction histidine kinase